MITNIADIPENIMGVYLIQYDNNKIYIGQSVNIKRRAYEHNNKNVQICDKSLKQHDAILKILVQTDNKDLLDDIETTLIKKYQSNDKNIGYNVIEETDCSYKTGIESPNALFDLTTLNEIIDLLMNQTNISIKTIAERYNTTESTIIRISQGKSYFNHNLSYPLRQHNHESTKKQLLDYFSSEENLINLKEDLKYSWWLNIEPDLVNKYNLPIKVLRNINNGYMFQDIGNYSYPIRAKNQRNNLNLTQQNVKDILQQLRYSNESMTNIGLKYGLHRNAISNINKGLTYLIKDYNYPARTKSL